MKPPHHHYNFCSRCKGDLEEKSEKLLVCKKCKFHFYINPIPCNGLILENEKGEIVLIRRKYDPGKGMLDVPGGFVDIDENFDQSLVREIKEELGFELKDFKYLGSYKGRYLFQGINYYTVCATYTAKVLKEEFQALDDVGEIVKFKPNEIPMEEIAFQAVKDALSDYLKKK